MGDGETSEAAANSSFAASFAALNQVRPCVQFATKLIFFLIQITNIRITMFTNEIKITMLFFVSGTYVALEALWIHYILPLTQHM